MEADNTNENHEKDARVTVIGNAFQTEYTIPFQSDNFQVNGSRDKKRERNKLRNKSNNNKENIKLQKFVMLRDTNGGANEETDI